jgi:hypothetical protein
MVVAATAAWWQHNSGSGIAGSQANVGENKDSGGCVDGDGSGNVGVGGGSGNGGQKMVDSNSNGGQSRVSGGSSNDSG